MVLVPIGSVINASPASAANSLTPHVAMSIDGSFVITSSSIKAGESAPRVHRSQFSITGGLQRSSFEALGRNLDVALSGDGHTILGGVYDHPDRKELFSHNIYPTGGTEVIYKAPLFYTATSQSFAVNPDGSYFMAWGGGSSLTKRDDIYLQKFNPKGELVSSSPLRVNSYGAGSQGDAQIATDGEGNPIVVWSGEGTEDDYGIYARFHNQSLIDGSTGTQILVNSTKKTTQMRPAIASNADGDVVIVWESYAPDNGVQIFGQRFDSAGNPQGTEFQISTMPGSIQPEVVMNAEGEFTVTWANSQNNESEIYARQFTANGLPRGNEFIVNSELQGKQTAADIAMDAEGDIVITWQSERKDKTGNEILAQRYEARSRIEFATPTYVVNEDAGILNLRVNRLDEAQLRSEVTISLSEASDVKAKVGEDFEFSGPIKLVFEPGETSKEIEIPIIQDGRTEGDEYAYFELTGDTRAVIDKTKASAAVIIIDDDEKEPILGTEGNDILTGTEADETFFGYAGNDKIYAKAGRDILAGASEDFGSGVREIDILKGGEGGDRFILGDEANAYYNDGIHKKPGFKDYALIKDFKVGEGDVVELYGKPANYSLGASPKGMPKGKAIYLETGKVDELIAIVQGEQFLDLSSSSFDFSKTVT